MTEKLRHSTERQSEMMLVAPNHEALDRVSDEVHFEDIATMETQQLIDEMLRIAKGEQGDLTRRTMVGLAAPQIGINKRIIVVDTASTGMGETPDLRVFINPKIVAASQVTEQGREGCFSTGNVCGVVERPSQVVIEAFDRNGEVVSGIWEGFTARIFQHEIDHLEGVRFPDRISDDSKLHWVDEDKFGEYRTHWMEWQKICSRERWLEVKRGVG